MENHSVPSARGNGNDSFCQASTDFTSSCGMLAFIQSPEILELISGYMDYFLEYGELAFPLDLTYTAAGWNRR